jgi:hypothetical protein
MKILNIVIDCIEKRCSDSIPSELYRLDPLLNIAKWKRDDLFTLEFVSSNGVKNGKHLAGWTLK